MDLERIIQRENETVEDFAKRVIEEVKNNEKQYEMEFSDGKILKTEDYNLEDEQAFLESIVNNQNKELGTDGPKENSDIKTKQRAVMIEIKECIDLLEVNIVPKQQEEVTKLEEKLKKLNDKLDKVKKELEAKNKPRLELLKKEIEKSAQLDAKKINAINIRIKRLEDELKLHQEDVKTQEENLREEETLLANYEEQFDKLKQEENPNYKQLAELESKIAYQKWAIEAYTEYIEFINTEYVEPNQIQIQEEEEKKTQIISAGKERANELNPSYENNPEVIVIKEAIEKIEEELEITKETANFQSLREMISSQVAPVAITEKLIELTEGFDTLVIEDTIGLNKGKINSKNVTIEKIKVKIEGYNERLNNKENYIKEDEKLADQALKDELQQEIEANKEEIEMLEDQMLNITMVPKLKKQLKAAIANREYLESRIENEIVTDKIVVESYERRIQKLTEKEEELNNKIEKARANKKLITEKSANKKIEKLRQKILENQADIDEINSKTSDDYIDIDAIAKDEINLRKLEEQLEKLEKAKDDLSKLTVEDIKLVIIQDYMKLKEKNFEDVKITEEEIVQNYEEETEEFGISEEEIVQNYEEAPKNLIEKIKSSSFVKKAAKALAGIVAGVVVVAGITGIVNNKDKEKDSSDVITEDQVANEEESYDVKDVNIDLEEPTTDISKEKTDAKSDTNTSKDVVKAEIDILQEAALQDIIDRGIVHDNVYDAANETNALKVNNNISSWEGAKAGAIYALKDGEKIEINLQDANKYMDEGYDIVSAYTNDGEIIGFTSLERTAGLQQDSNEKSR